MTSPSPSPRAAFGADEASSGHEGISIALAIEDEAWEAEGLGDIEALIRRCLDRTVEAAGLANDVETEIGITLTDDAQVQALNAEWRGKNKPTNVLSFPINDLLPGEAPGPMLGDLVLARETLRAEAALEDKPLADHFCHLIVHGTLHCLGYDHVEPDEAEAMEALEVRILDALGISDPYLMTEPEEEPSRA